MLKTKRGKTVKPRPGMTIKSLWSGITYKIKRYDTETKQFILDNGSEMPEDLDFELVSYGDEVQV